MIKTSIIVPVYNTAPYLRECFDSVFNQTQKEIEVIAVNDGSTDDSLCILEELQREHPALIIFSQDNKGLGAARNKGMELAAGEYICFLDSDDCLADTAIETCYRCAKENRLDMVMFDAETFGDSERKKGAYDRRQLIKEQESVMSGEEYARKYWLTAYYPTAWLTYLSARFLKENHLRFLPGVYYEDNEFHCKSLPLASRIMYLPQALYRRRYREGAITTSAFDMRHARDMLCIIQAMGRQEHGEILKDTMARLVRRFLRSLLNRCLENHLLEGSGFAGEFLEKAAQVWGDSIEDVKDRRNVEILCEICHAVSDDALSGEARKRVYDQRKRVFRALFSPIPLSTPESCVGIYGTGRYAERFFREYEENVGEIRAGIVPIDSGMTTGEKKYRGWDVVNVNDIGGMALDCIVIASAKYEEEICQNLSEKYGEKFSVIRLKGDLDF